MLLVTIAVNISYNSHQRPWHLHIRRRGHLAWELTEIRKTLAVRMHRDSSCKSQDIISEEKKKKEVVVEMLGISLKCIDLISSFIIREKCRCIFGKVLELKPMIFNHKLPQDV